MSLKDVPRRAKQVGWDEWRGEECANAEAPPGFKAAQGAKQEQQGSSQTRLHPGLPDRTPGRGRTGSKLKGGASKKEGRLVANADAPRALRPNGVQYKSSSGWKQGCANADAPRTSRPHPGPRPHREQAKRRSAQR